MAGKIKMESTMMTRTTRLIMASGFLRSRRIPSRKNVVERPMTSV